MISLPIWAFVLLIVASSGYIAFPIWWCVAHYKDKKVYEKWLEQEFGDSDNEKK